MPQHRFGAIVAFSIWVYHAAAASAPVFFFTKFPTSSAELRNELIERMDTISHWSCSNEPGVSKYALVVPDEDNGKTAYSIEQYADDPTFENHLAADMVANTLFAWSTSIAGLFEDEVVVHNFTVLDGMSFVKPQFAESDDPYVVVQGFTFKDGEGASAFEFWKEMISATMDEEGTLLFGIYGSPEDADKIYTLAAYESPEYLTGIHATSWAAKELEEKTEDLVSESWTTHLRKKGGFLYKGYGSCA